ncbi:hypothetical protein HZC09_02700 [Candidatus Micrarchaeota archaeon]|nr:hypothetical protein [Candidatus Micrarchaeota archaeon]
MFSLADKVETVLKRLGCATAGELYRLCRPCGYNYFCRVLSNLVTEGKALRLKRGVYCSPDADEFVQAMRLFPSGSLAFASALSFHGVLSEGLSVTFVSGGKRKKSVKTGSHVFRLVPAGRFSSAPQFSGGVCVTSLAQTFFDCLNRPEFAGGEGKVVEAMRNALAMKKFGAVEWRELGFYLARAPSRLRKRAAVLFAGLAPRRFLRRL